MKQQKNFMMNMGIFMNKDKEQLLKTKKILEQRLDNTENQKEKLQEQLKRYNNLFRIKQMQQDIENLQIINRKSINLF